MTAVVTSDTDAILRFLSSFTRREIEIGSGNGHFLTSYADRYRECACVGIELKSKRCAKIREKAEKRQLTNVAVFHGTAHLLLSRLPTASIDAFHVYFPDPWLKTKHRKRRFFKFAHLDSLHSLLTTSGHIYFATDIVDYHIQTKLLAVLHGGFEIHESGLPEEALCSIFAEKTLHGGGTAHSLVFVKQEHRIIRDGVE